MKAMGKLPWLMVIVILVIIPITSAQAGSEKEDEGEAVLVGRISYVQGKVLRYVPEEEGWVAIVKDTPFGLHDALHSEGRGRAEIIMPNNTWARIDGDTEIRLIALRTDVTEIEVDSGVARFYNKGFDAVIEARTPFGYVTGPGETTFNLCVGDDSIEVVALKGTAYFVHEASGARIEVVAGSSSIVADNREVTAGELRPDLSWNAWNNEMDALWAERIRVRGKSAEYLPPPLRSEAYVLDECGRWERVYYNGAHYYFWRPLRVHVGWAPFTVGRWIVWCGDHTWVPCEPFGYITHHYGAWVFVGGLWYWAPPVRRIRVRIGPPPPPLFPFPFFWCPGRVAWIHWRGRMGWVPLAPWERYYWHRRWGPRAVVVRNVNITSIHVNINSYKYVRHAVIIDKKDLYRAKSYSNTRVTRINKATIRNNYRAVPVVNNRVIGNYGNSGQKYGVANIDKIGNQRPPAIEKTHMSQIGGKPSGNLRVKMPGKDGGKNERGEIAKGALVKPPRVEEKAMPVNKAKRQAPGKFDEGTLKRRATLPGGPQRPVGGDFQRQGREMPPKALNRETVQRESHGQTTRGEEKPWTQIDRKPPKVQPLPQKERNLAGNQPREMRGRILLRPDQPSQTRARGGNSWANRPRRFTPTPMGL